MSVFCCPNCGKPLSREEHRMVCPMGHSFDVAKSGYVNLLLSQQTGQKHHGDDKRMVKARSTFLGKGYYDPMRQELIRQGKNAAQEGMTVLDAGCGEGYYTSGIYRRLLAEGKQPQMAGIDISKCILRAAAKRDRDIEFAVASSYHLPAADGCADLLLDCFSPLALEEFRRVLKPGGLFFYVVPAADHLWELKQVLYDRPYPNEEKETPYEGFSYEAIVPVEDTITLESQTDIHALFQMTPYYWKTPRAGAERLAALETLTTRISFRVHIFRKL